MTSTAATAGEFFARRAERYDEQARLGLPGYDVMLDELTRSLPDDPESILELGCGTGALTARVARRFPEARIHAIDAAQEMIAIADERMGALVSGQQLSVPAPRPISWLSWRVRASEMWTASGACRTTRSSLPSRSGLGPSGAQRFAEFWPAPAPWSSRVSRSSIRSSAVRKPVL